MKTKKKKRTTALHVRKVQAADWPAVSVIYEQCFGPAYDGLKNSHDSALVAVKGGTVIGFALYDVREDEVYVANVGVHQDHRSCGTCNKMAKALVKLLPKLHRSKMTLIVAEDNPHARKCYRAAGFRQPRKTEAGYGGSMLDMVYSLPRKRKASKKAAKKAA